MTGLRVVEEAPAISVTDRVRDVMVLTVPRLAVDEQFTLVEPDAILPDDGCAKHFAKQFVYDDTPGMQVTNEVHDLMRLAVPSIEGWSDDSSVADCFEEIPEDGLEAEWFIVPPVTEVPFEVSDAACAAFDALMATGYGFAGFVTEDAEAQEASAASTLGTMLSAPVAHAMIPAPVVPLGLPAASEFVATVPATESLVGDENAVPLENTPLVTFSFGPQKVPDAGWRVRFSF